MWLGSTRVLTFSTTPTRQTTYIYTWSDLLPEHEDLQRPGYCSESRRLWFKGQRSWRINLGVETSSFVSAEVPLGKAHRTNVFAGSSGYYTWQLPGVFLQRRMLDPSEIHLNKGLTKCAMIYLCNLFDSECTCVNTSVCLSSCRPEMCATMRWWPSRKCRTAANKRTRWRERRQLSKHLPKDKTRVVKMLWRKQPQVWLFCVLCRNGRTSLKRWSSCRNFVTQTLSSIEDVTWRSTQHGYVLGPIY